jgi:hypothetical protein
MVAGYGEAQIHVRLAYLFLVNVYNLLFPVYLNGPLTL